MPAEHSTVTQPPSPPPAPDGTAERRRALRSARIAARQALAPAERSAATARIEAALDGLLAELAPRCLGFCWPWQGEVDLLPWMARWLAADPARQAALPVVVEAAAAMGFRRWTPDTPMTADRHGIPVPATDAPVQPDVLLVPLNVFDGAGFRLGYGGGYFDRTLAALRPAPTGIGVAFELARADTVWPQPHDLPIDWIVTEAGAFRPRQG